MARQLTVSPEGVFSDGVRLDDPDPHEVAQALSAPSPLELWVRDAGLIAALEDAAGRGAAAGGAGHDGARHEPDGEDELLWGEGEESAGLVRRLRVRFHPVAGGVGFFVGDAPFILSLQPRELAFATAKLVARHAAQGIDTPNALQSAAASRQLELALDAAPAEEGTPESGEAKQRAPEPPPVMAAVHYFLHTGQEIDILERSASDGKRGEHWRTEPLVGKRIYEHGGGSHRVELRQDDLLEAGNVEELDLDTLERLTLAQDTDFAFAMLYVISTLSPPEPLEANLFAGGWIDLDDVMEKIGWYPARLTASQREAKRARVWNYLCYGNRAVVVGQRTGNYRDPITGETIPTRIESSIWRIMSIERPVQRALIGEVPRRVQVVISKEWEPLLVSARLAQYLPLAEAVGRIPPQKVAGDWARAIALVLARLWRMRPQEFLAGRLRPTRRELLTHYTPKTQTAEDLLSGSNPKRAVQYWHDALAILCDIGFIAREGEASRSVADTLKPYGGYGWQGQWLDEAVDLRPGETLLRSLEARAAALPAAPAKRRRGRPPKKPTRD